MTKQKGPYTNIRIEGWMHEQLLSVVHQRKLAGNRGASQMALLREAWEAYTPDKRQEPAPQDPVVEKLAEIERLNPSMAQALRAGIDVALKSLRATGGDLERMAADAARAAHEAADAAEAEEGSRRPRRKLAG